MAQRLALMHTLKTDQRMIISNEYWDERLTGSKHNPFPLAPKNLIDKSEVTKKIYEINNRAWGKFVTKIMIEEHFTGSICVLGAGLTRDLGWIPIKLKKWVSAEPKRNTVIIADSSKVGCDNAKKFLQKHHLHRKIKVKHTEILDGWEHGDIVDEEVDAYFLSQFIEHQEDKMPEFMYHLGKFLKVTGRVVYLVTPTLDDNPKDQIIWEHAKPFYRHRLVEELEEGLKRRVLVEVLGKHTYFDRTYTFFKFS
jgi:hypothetical protein